MKIASWVHGGLLLMAIIACKRESAPPEEAKRKSMIVNGLEVSMRLSREGSVYSFQEDVHLLVSIRNLADTEVVIPHLPGYPSTWVLKNRQTGKETTQAFRPTPIPGLPLDLDPPQATLIGKASHTYALEISQYLGTLPVAKHSVRFHLEDSLTRFESPWLDFEVGNNEQSDITGKPSNSGHAHEFRLVWVDRAIAPNRILLRTTPIHDNRNLPATTKVIGTGEVQGGLAVSASHADSHRIPAWVAWIEAGKVRLVNAEGMDSASGHDFNLPEGAAWSLLEGLTAARLAQDGTLLMGALIQTGEASPSVLAFDWKGGKDLHWAASFALASGAARPFPVLIPNAGGGSILGWFQDRDGKTNLCMASRKPEGDFAADPARIKLDLAVSDITDFDLKPGTSGVAWAVLARDSKPTRYKVHSGVAGGPKAVKPAIWILNGSGSDNPVNVAIDSNDNPWVTFIGPDGVKVQSREWKATTSVKDSKGSETALLFFRRGDLPKVLLKGKGTGFAIAGVQYPDGGDTSEDFVEDNQ